MDRRTTGWLFVAGQVVLLVLLVVLPGRGDWPTPSWLRTMAQALFVAGIVVLVVAALGLGRALTPTPVPSQRGELRTTGMYRYVRHPIYSAVLLLVAGITLRSGSWLTLAVAAVTVVFFDRKARWEEARLAERYRDYLDYAARTPRFLPGRHRDR